MFNWNRQAKELVRIENILDAHAKLLQKHADALAELDDKHVRLRGKVYAHKLHKGPEPEPEEVKPVDQLTREELRRSLISSGRFIPGRAPSHDK